MVSTTGMDSEAVQKDDLELRQINCELNALTRVDGSALFAQGGTSVIASMIGPVDVKQQNLSIDEAYVECIYRPLVGQQTTKDKLREHMIKEACEKALLTTLHPRTTISIQIQELDDRCGLEACAINAACMALLIGGVPMKFTIAAVHCIINKEGKLVLDPDYCDAIGCTASFTFIYDSLEKNLVGVHTTGHFRMAQLSDAELMCRAASGIIFDFYRNHIAEFHNKSLLTASVRNESKQKGENEPMEA